MLPRGRKPSRELTVATVGVRLKAIGDKGVICTVCTTPVTAAAFVATYPAC